MRSQMSNYTLSRSCRPLSIRQCLHLSGDLILSEWQLRIFKVLVAFYCRQACIRSTFDISDMFRELPAQKTFVISYELSSSCLL